MRFVVDANLSPRVAGYLARVRDHEKQMKAAG